MVRVLWVSELMPFVGATNMLGQMRMLRISSQQLIWKEKQGTPTCQAKGRQSGGTYLSFRGEPRTSASGEDFEAASPRGVPALLLALLLPTEPVGFWLPAADLEPASDLAPSESWSSCITIQRLLQHAGHGQLIGALHEWSMACWMASSGPPALPHSEILQYLRLHSAGTLAVFANLKVCPALLYAGWPMQDARTSSKAMPCMYALAGMFNSASILCKPPGEGAHAGCVHIWQSHALHAWDWP